MPTPPLAAPITAGPHRQTHVPFRSDEDLFEQSKMSFGEHLEELRATLWKCVVALAIASLFGFYWGDELVRFIQAPLQDALDTYRVTEAAESTGLEKIVRDGETFIPQIVYELVDGQLQKRTQYVALDQGVASQVIGTNVTDSFMVYVKASLLLGVVISSPALFYFIWQFVASGLYQHERKWVYVFMPFSLGLFLAGAALAFFFAIGLVVDYLFKFNLWLNIAPMPRINEWLSFVLMLPLGFGVAFQLPLVMLFLERIGVFGAADFSKHWKIAVLVIAILSMLLTPSDPGSMILLAVPLTFLYFGGIALCRFMPRRESPFGEPLE
ncbi:Sec-independent protein translocase protein TatCy [Posidoniimonas corsicana]|uniref:Sec-independent protein translocase protein TatC n=1 Tax=Posidoniimonas corsicana TaxID=1938618 RepID=A0A5C5VIH4_9BACT|nr:twin-arginine translocase subunit TatC [Posidoniimonas corsicana]TWT37833.1 Sec-independent protein translocase protein TatCy [Posidoniimonas corsicana]